MTIRLYNTKTRQKDDFTPLDPSNVRMYVCGPTVYDRAHIGNARPVVVFDVLYRLLRHEYGDDAVTYVRNFTDVDDKINAKAVDTKRDGETLVEAVRRITDETIGWYHEDMDALGALRPTHEPRATEYIKQMIAMGEDLIARGHAYVAEGHVLFEARTDPEYGSLSRRPLDEMRAGARVEVAPYKRDPMDSVIWKPSTDDQPGWDSPWGRGRPGWHIECSAMAGDLLGDHFDIHGGGIDLQFPHHENEWAQSRCVGHDFANVWMHNGYLMVEGEKMSKSLGNFFTVADLRKQGVPGEVMRLAMLMTHYTKPLDWTGVKLTKAELLLAELQGLLGSGGSERLKSLEPSTPFNFIVDALSNDLNTPLALSKMSKKNLRKQLKKTGLAEFLEQIYATQLLLGFDLKDSEGARLRATRADDMASLVDVHVDGFEKAKSLAKRLDTARSEKNFELADKIRSILVSAGLEVRSASAETRVSILPTFDPSKLPEVEDV